MLTRSATAHLRVPTLTVRDRPATLDIDGYQVFTGLWHPHDAQAAIEAIRNIGGESYGLRISDPLRKATPEDDLPLAVVFAALHHTACLGLEGDVTQENIVCIPAFTGATRQSDHIDTANPDAFTVLHILNTRFLHVAGDYVRLEAGDVVVMRGGVCHAGAAHNLDTPSYLIHVPVGFNEGFTRPCRN